MVSIHGSESKLARKLLSRRRSYGSGKCASLVSCFCLFV